MIVNIRAVTCRMCKSKFFPASLKFHTKVCAEKQDHIDLPCDHCRKKFPPTVLQTHMKICKRDSRRARTARGMRCRYQDPMEVRSSSVEGSYNAPAGASPARGQQQQLPVATTLRVRKKCSPILNSHSSDIEPGSEQQSIDDGEHRRRSQEDIGDVVVASSDGRVACSNCYRRFSSERVGVHQEICERVNTEENRERRRRRRTIKGVGSNVRSATQQQRPRPNRSASEYGAARRRRAQEFPPGCEHDRTRRTIDGSERLVMADTYSAPQKSTGQSWGAASTEPRASRLHLAEKMKKREGGHHRWSHTENRRPSIGTPRVARRGIAQRARPSSAVGWVSSTAKPADGSREVPTNARALSSTWSPAQLDRSDSVTVWSTRGVGRAARCIGGNGGGGGGGGGGDGGHRSGRRRHNVVGDAFPLQDVTAMPPETGDAGKSAINRYDVPPQSAFFAPPGARRKIPFFSEKKKNPIE